jgi:hypothetical protein
MRMKPLNLYRSDGDCGVWERAELDAKAAGLSLSAHVVAALRSTQRAADASNGEIVAPLIEVVGAHIATETVDYPNAAVRLDAAGNVVSVEFAERTFVE